MGNDLIRRFFHQPVPRVPDDDAFDVFGDQAALLDQELAGRFFAGPGVDLAAYPELPERAGNAEEAR